MARVAAAWFAILLVSGVSAERQAEQRILFIGNSLTYWNELPAMVQSLARAGKARVTSDMVAFPDVSATFDDTSASQLSWVLNAYTITFASLLVPASSLRQAPTPTHLNVAFAKDPPSPANAKCVSTFCGL